MIELFLLGWLFWGLLLGYIVLGFVADAHEAPGAFAFVTAIAIGILWWTGTANIPLWIWHNPFKFVMWGALYLVVGVLWSFYKFDDLGRKKAEDYKLAKAINPGNKTEQVENPAWEAEATLAKQENRRMKPVDRYLTQEKQPPEVMVAIADYQPLALQNKHKITDWIILWWASMFMWVFRDMLRKFVDFMIRHFGAIYNKMAARHFQGLGT